ncbi:penicillin acylase family protein, partial [Diaphorobacter sp.]|uniref:penicillin acylase family protein n=1 Tax=Diaphorobacter sp. TaxID=1934310 RepID=UPI002589AB91
MPSVFISYRRDDSAGFAGRLADALEQRLGAGAVFRDVDDIQPGADFEAVIARGLDQVRAMLVVIGPGWLDAAVDGQRRLDRPDDFVRREVEQALASGKPVVPVLVGGATMPAANALPIALRGLANRQALVLGDASWSADLARLEAVLAQSLMPSPGWDGRYDWDGFADPMLHPYDQDPAQGWLGTANHRIAPRGYGMQLSSTWYGPERFERLAELAGRGKHDTRSTIAMQYDQSTTFAAKLKAMFEASGMAEPLRAAIAALPAGERAKAEEAYRRLRAFDGRLAASSADAALYGAFLHESARHTFLDELGPDDSQTWKALLQVSGLSYSAQADHLLGRDDSPFWDDIGTPQVEDKPAILARSLAAAVNLLEAQVG